MVKIQSAVVKEQGITFAITMVKPTYLELSDAVPADSSILPSPLFPGIPIVLMGQPFTHCRLERITCLPFQPSDCRRSPESHAEYFN